MGFLNKVREAARRAAEAIQEAGRRVIEAAREAVQFGREKEEEPLYKEETPPDHVSEEPPSWPEEYTESLSEKLKREDLEAREDQHRRAWESFNSDYMIDSPLSRMEYDLMWETIGEYSNDSEALGSPEIIEIYDEMTQKFGYDIDPEFVKEFLNSVIEKTTDATYAQDYVNAIYKAISKTGSVEEFYDTLQEKDFRGSYL